jgi:uncharacterized protein
MFILLQPVGLECQLSCVYCYYKNSRSQLRGSQIETKKMDISIADNILEGLAKLPTKHHTICLHGGEPLLIGKRWVGEFIDKIRAFNENTKKRISIAIQTNAIAVDEEWIELFKLGSMRVSLSIDGPKNIHDIARIDKIGNGTYDRVITSIQKLKQAGIEPTAISVVTKYTTSINPKDYYDFFLDIGLRNIDIHLYIEKGDSRIEELARISHEPDPTELPFFMKSLFDVWFQNSNPDSFVNIRLFEQTVAGLLGYMPTLCNRKGGFACAQTPCIMPDGTVYACNSETYQIDLTLGSLTNENFEDMFKPERVTQLLNRIKQTPQAMQCYSCNLLGLCEFACSRFIFAKRNLSSYCCQFSKDFIDHVKNRLNRLSEDICGDVIEFTTPFERTMANARTSQ